MIVIITGKRRRSPANITLSFITVYLFMYYYYYYGLQRMCQVTPKCTVDLEKNKLI